MRGRWALSAPVAFVARTRPPAKPELAGVPFAVALELPGVRGSQPVLQHLAVHAAPWPQALVVLRSTGGASFEAVTSVRQPALVRRLLGDLEPGPLWRRDQRNAVKITVGGDTCKVSVTWRRWMVPTPSRSKAPTGHGNC
jgi:hypothetical protein